MKKTSQLKKLTLSRETLTQLNEGHTIQVNGGVTNTCTAESVCNRNSCYC